MDQPGKVANPARGQLNRENNIPLSPCVPENLVSRDGFSCPVPRQPAHLHTQAEFGAYLRDSSRVPRRRPFMKPPYAIGSVPSLSGHAIACVHGWNVRVSTFVQVFPCVSSLPPTRKAAFLSLGRRRRVIDRRQNITIRRPTATPSSR